MQLSCDPAITLLLIYLKELNFHVHTRTYTQTSVENVFKVTKNWIHPRYPRTVNNQMIKQTMVPPYHVLQFSSKKEQTIDRNNDLDESLEDYAK